jgi:hypothetical protein
VRFYVVIWREEGGPEGYGWDFATTKREAKKIAKEHLPEASPCKSCRAWLDDENPPLVHPGQRCDVCGDFGDGSDEQPEIKPLDFHGTPKQIAFSALRYQVVS